MIQFYCPEIETNPILSESESAHCCRVLRMKDGDEIHVTDGKGKRFLCEILRAHPSHTEIKIKECEYSELDKGYRITLAVAPTKNSDRIEWLAEKCVEIGIDRIVLLQCHRSERKYQKAGRLEKVMVSAMKQSLSANLPEIEEMTSFNNFIRSSESERGQKFFGYCSKEFPRKEFVKEYKAGNDVIVMIGPEGDFTDQEVEEAVNRGFIPVSFGEKRLRTETAGVFAVSAVNVINQLS